MHVIITAMKDLLPATVPGEPSAIEPGLLPVFRTVVALQLGLGVVGMLVRIFSGDEGLPLTLPVFNLVWGGALLLYLSSARLVQRLGRLYLPLALAFATFCTMVEYFWDLQSLAALFGQQRVGFVLSASGWRLLVGLLAPLVIVASQYRLRSVAAYVITIASVELVIHQLILSQRAYLAGIAAIHAGVFGLIAYIVNRAVTAQRSQREALAAANLQLAQHAATLEQLTVSRERNRLARELHDTLAHTLSAVSVQLEAVDSAWETQPGRARELLTKAQAQTRSGLSETRRALQALRAAPLDDLGLALAVRTLAESTARRGGLQLQTAIGDDLSVQQPEVEQQVYRIAQEALANVLKHAGARTLAVSLQRSTGLLTLAIVDDGVGFAVNHAMTNGHYGLEGMRERAELIGGQLTVESAAAAGTTVRLTLPEGTR